MAKPNYLTIENDFNRVFSALKVLADKDTIESLNRVAYVLAEIRHAQVLLDDNTSLLDVEGRLMLALFNKPEPQARIIKADGWMLVHMDTLEPVRENDVLTSFRGGEYTITGGTPPHKPSSTGRVYVTGGVEFFPTVFSLKWIKATTH